VSYFDAYSRWEFEWKIIVTEGSNINPDTIEWNYDVYLNGMSIDEINSMYGVNTVIEGPFFDDEYIKIDGVINAITVRYLIPDIYTKNGGFCPDRTRNWMFNANNTIELKVYNPNTNEICSNDVSKAGIENPADFRVAGIEETGQMMYQMLVLKIQQILELLVLKRLDGVS